MISSGDRPSGILLDAGPVIAAIDCRDEHHVDAASGFRLLVDARTRLLIPVPIVFEVYKRVAYLMSERSARDALQFMRSGFEFIYFTPDDLDHLQELIDSMPWWGGSLEDALLVMTGLERDVPVWTYNYRDLKAFPNLTFWTPA